MTATINGLPCAVKFHLKKVLCLGVTVGNNKPKEDNIVTIIEWSINFIVSSLTKGWQNVKSICIKTTTGAPVQLYGDDLVGNHYTCMAFI